VKFLRPIVLFAAGAALLPASSALAQREPPPSPEQRIDRLERQLQQVQRQVFPRGRPADTAGFSNEPAATQSSVATLDQRLDALERQMSDMLRQSEENGHRLQTLDSDLGRLRTDQEQRLSTLEQRMNAADANASAAPVAEPAERATAPKPATIKPPAARANSGKPITTSDATNAPGGAAAGGPAIDAGEEAYTQAFRLFDAGQYDDAITALRAFSSAFPKHRRASYANNLIGRALLDKGEPRAAAEALLANYRTNPKGERAADSLYYLGQALMKLGQPGQACKAYSELDAVYGANVRPDLKKLVADARAQANCS
jgi:TolA-binding protein